MRILAGFGVGWTLLALPGAAAENRELRASYAIAFAGLPFATATLDLAVRDSTYTARVSYRTAGATRILTDAAGVATTNGAYKGGRFIPAGFDLAHRNGRRNQKVVFEMVAGAVKTMTVDPPLELTSDQFPIEPAHLTAIADPLSALLIPVVPADGKTPVGPCDRTLPILDGMRRYDVRLEPKATGTTSQKGFSGPTSVCRVVLKPFRADRQSKGRNRHSGSDRGHVRPRECARPASAYVAAGPNAVRSGKCNHDGVHRRRPEIRC